MYDMVSLHLVYGIPFWHDYHDSLLLHHMLWSHLPHNLADMTKAHTTWGGYENEVKNAVAALAVKLRGYWRLPFNVVARKNAYDAAITRHLAIKFLDIVRKDKKLSWVYDNITIPESSP